MRDKDLDICRGAIMIYITCFIHLMYWEGVSVGIFTSEWVSLILVEMPIIFYIAGASYSLSSKKRYPEYVWSRIKRVAVPYWEYALFCFPVVLAFYWKKGQLMPVGDLFLYVFFTPPPVPRIFSHIWFILPYLLISLCFPLVSWGINRYRLPFLFFGVCLALLVFICNGYPEVILSVIVYLIFAIWGMYYRKGGMKLQVAICVVVAVLYMFYALRIEGREFNMQLNKFPPNMIFVSYCLIVLGICGSYMKSGVIRLYSRFSIVRKYIDIYAKDGYSIYLVHPFSTALLYGFKHILDLNRYIAENYSLKIIYILVGFLFLLYMNIYILRLYNFLLSLLYKLFRLFRMRWQI